MRLRLRWDRESWRGMGAIATMAGRGGAGMRVEESMNSSSRFPGTAYLLECSQVRCRFPVALVRMTKCASRRRLRGASD